jgi:lysophospholipase L1-like esterase
MVRLTATLVLLLVVAQAPPPGQWVATWTTAPAGVAGTPERFRDETLRLIVRTSAGGQQVRVRLSNLFGTEPLAIGAAHIARRATGARIVARTDRVLTFGGQPSIMVPKGGEVISDAVALDVAPLSDLAVSVFLPVATPELTTHVTALQTNYVSRPGDHTAAVAFDTARTLTRWPFLAAVEVSGTARSAAIVAFGDSITDGANSSVDANRRWPDLLAARLQQQPDLRHLSVLNQGIIGNRILHPSEPQFGNLFGASGLVRFDRDVLGHSGARFLIVLLGINDIGHPGSAAPVHEEVSAENIAGGYRQFIERARAKGLRVFGGTLLPFEHTTIDGFYSPEKEAQRQAVNQWIRTSGAFDAVIDFDKAVRDPARPTRMLPAYDSGDHLHPNDAGMKVMADAIPLELFRVR